MSTTFLKPKRWIYLLLIGSMLLATLGVTSAASAKAACSSPYIVQSGDTLRGIAQKCGVTLNALLKANPAITNPNLIFRGQRLVIPGSESTTIKYTVKAGDTLESIAEQFDVSTGLILLNNPQINPIQLVPGQVITIPVVPVIPETGSNAVLRLSMYSGLPGTNLTVTGSGFPARQDVSISATSSGVSASASTNATTDRNGSFSAQLRIPASAPAGSTWVIMASTQSTEGPLASATFQVISLPASGAYVVQSGDTLSKIAQRYHTSVNALLRANPQITNANRLQPGDLIYLPGSVLVDPNTGLTFYIVQSGDYLGAIAQRFGTTLQALLAANPQIQSPSRIFPGDRITIPAGSIIPVTGSSPSTYTVRSGDTLLKIAQRFGLPLRLLELANPQLSNPNRLTAGQKINIPGRIQFAAGGTSAVVSGSLDAGDEAYYVLRAGSRNLLEVTSSPDPGLELAIYGANGGTIKADTEGSPNFRDYLPATQDYLLVVHASQAADFTLNVDIPARISFAAGDTSATVSGTLAPHTSQYYVLRALKGQQLKVSASPQDENMRLVIYGFDGDVLRSGMSSGAPTFNGTLPSTQDYIIVLTASDQVLSYRMTVTIPPL